MVQQLFHRHISGNFRAGKVDHLRNSVIKAQLSLFHQLQHSHRCKKLCDGGHIKPRIGPVGYVEGAVRITICLAEALFLPTPQAADAAEIVLFRPVLAELFQVFLHPDPFPF